MPHTRDTMFWLISLYVLNYTKLILNVKNTAKKFKCSSGYFVHKVCEKRHFCGSCKRISRKNSFWSTENCLFYTRHISFAKLYVPTYNVRMYALNLIWFFRHFEILFFASGCIHTYEPNLISPTTLIKHYFPPIVVHKPNLISPTILIKHYFPPIVVHTPGLALSQSFHRWDPPKSIAASYYVNCFHGL